MEKNLVTLGFLLVFGALGNTRVYADADADESWNVERSGECLDVSTSVSQFCIGDKVLLRGHYEGTITAIYSSGIAAFKFPNGSEGVYSLSEMGRAVKALNEFHVGDTVLLRGHYEGTITAIYSSGSAAFMFPDGSKGVYLLSEIVSLNNCSSP